MTATLVRLTLAFVCLHACMAGTRLAAPLQALRGGQGEVAVGVLLALFALTQVFLALPAGRYVDRHGLRRPAALAVVAATSGTLAAALWPVFGVLCLAALLTGGASGVLLIAIQRQAGALARDPTQIKQIFSWLAIGPALSNFLGPFAAGIMIDLAGFRWAFLMLASLPVLCWLVLRGVPAHASGPHTADQPPGPRGRAWELLKDPPMRRLLVVNWLLSASWDVHVFVVPVLGHERGLSASVIGTLLGSFAIAAAAIRVVMPLVADRLSEWRVLVTAMLLSMALFAVYPFSQGAWTMGLCSVLLGFTLGSVQPMAMSMLHQITPPHRYGEALALRLMAINASSVMMPMVFGAAGALVGVSAVFWAAAALLGTGVPTARRLRSVTAGRAAGSP